MESLVNEATWEIREMQENQECLEFLENQETQGKRPARARRLKEQNSFIVPQEKKN